MEKSTAYNKIRAKGLTISFLEAQMSLPRNTFHNFVNGAKPLPSKHIPAVKRILKKYKIKLAV
jgi:hypothetical protein